MQTSPVFELLSQMSVASAGSTVPTAFTLLNIAAQNKT
jgi:hypothetical protein